MSRLSELDDAEGRGAICTWLCEELMSLMFQNMHVKDKTEEGLVNLCTTGELCKSLRETNEVAVDLARTLMKERAGFTLDVPNLKKHRYFKQLDDDLMTCDGSAIGVAGGPEEDAEGEIRVVGSPMLWKWGDPNGRGLEQRMLLVKAFVQVSKAERPFETSHW